MPDSGPATYSLMVDMETFRARLESALSLASQGRLADSLAELDSGLGRATKSNSHRWIVHFARNAALIHDRMGDLVKAKKYYSLALRHDKSEPGLYYSLADVYERLGNTKLSRRYFKTCHELAIKQNDQDFLEILEKREGERGTG